MNIKVLKNFTRDNINFVLIYFITHVLISLYHSYFNKSLNYIYLISIFIIFIIIKYIKYYVTNKEIRKLIDNIEVDDKKFTCDQKEVIELIYNIHNNYETKIYESKLQTENTHRFISQWIHNMKTPLSVIDLIIQKYKINEVKSAIAIDHIEGEKEIILRNLNQVLKVFRLESFTTDYIPENIDLIVVVRKVINANKNHFLYNNVYPIMQGKDENAVIMTDSKWNEAMLEQIISNAIKYSNASKKPKNVYFCIEELNNEIILKIRDEGIGIPYIDLERVFEPFFTGTNGRSNHNATGIGLYFCSEVAKKLGHSIKISSVVGKGTEVTVQYLSKLKGTVTKMTF
ncbi:sensor histidine kinase [Clostridium estertheticum]|uniref:sensor histidine kinase n=1 Tax=Clostridium estertheticum TaxID=238834 RepID=UPI0013EE60FE|nr:sensor histidine kinase [Clostridium estertheticum]MBZ9609058.1 sensor histidine kinase [Clostridium estertheticum]